MRSYWIFFASITMSMSKSTLKRRLVQYKLKRNKENVKLTDVERLIINELDGLGSVSGYRGMWHTLRVKYGVYVPKQQVASVLEMIDSHGVEERKRHKLKRREYFILPQGPSTVGILMDMTNRNLVVSQSTVLLTL